VTSFQWVRRGLSHTFGWSSFPTWGFTDSVGVPNGWNVLRVIFRVGVWGDNSADGSSTAWEPSSGYVIHNLFVMRGSQIETTLAQLPAPLQPTYVHNPEAAPNNGWSATWASPPVHADIEVRRSAGSAPQDQLDIAYGWTPIIGPVTGAGASHLGPSVHVEGTLEVLCSIA
jgi:hypothetical protein